MSLLKVCLFALWVGLVVPGHPAFGDETRTITADEVTAKRGRVLDLKVRSKDIRKAAEQRFQADSVECRKAVLVNHCLGNARDRRLEKIDEARALEMDVGALEREIRRFDLNERRAERAKRLEQNALPASVSVEGVGTTNLQQSGTGTAPAVVQ